MNLSKHFTLEELTISQTASRHGIDNTPNDLALSNLLILAITLEEIRDMFNQPIIISSGYRSPVLNSLINGSKTSAHMRGSAADIIVPAFGRPFDVIRVIMASNLEFDQLIYEFKSWIHVGISKVPRKEILTINKNGVIKGLVDL